MARHTRSHVAGHTRQARRGAGVVTLVSCAALAIAAPGLAEAKPASSATHTARAHIDNRMLPASHKRHRPKTARHSAHPFTVHPRHRSQARSAAAPVLVFGGPTYTFMGCSKAFWSRIGRSIYYGWVYYCQWNQLGEEDRPVRVVTDYYYYSTAGWVYYLETASPAGYAGGITYDLWRRPGF